MAAQNADRQEKKEFEPIIHISKSHNERCKYGTTYNAFAPSRTNKLPRKVTCITTGREVDHCPAFNSCRSEKMLQEKMVGESRMCGQSKGCSKHYNIFTTVGK